MKHKNKILIMTTLAISMSSCYKGGKFFQQSGEQAAVEDFKLVETTVVDGKATGTISANSGQTQLLAAPEGSEISGASAEFPVGALAIDSQISIGAGGDFSDDLLLQQLSISNAITNAGVSVQIDSSKNIDTAVPMTLNIPLPSGSSLLEGDHANLVVFYEIKKAALGKSFKGVYIRSQLIIKNGFVGFKTNHFGTFQAALTESVIKAPIEINENALNVATKKSVYYRQGVRALTSFDSQGQIQQGFQAWMAPFSPTHVKNTNSFTSWYRQRPIP